MSTEPTCWADLQNDGIDGDTYGELLAEFTADKAEYCRAVDADGCACPPHPDLPGCGLLNRWCREHGILALVPAELTCSHSGIRGGEPIMLGTRVPVEDVSTLLADGATWDFVKETYPSIPTPASGVPHEPAQIDADGLAAGKRGTGVREAEKPAQAADLIEAVRNAHTQCDCDECLGKIAAAVLNHGAASLHAIADHMPDTEVRPGIRYAATLLSHTADDEGDGDA